LVNEKKNERGANLYFAGLRLDPVRRKLWQNNKEIDLPSKECSLLIFFMHHPNQILSRTMISGYVWGTAKSRGNMVDDCVISLQGKIDLISDKNCSIRFKALGTFSG